MQRTIHWGILGTGAIAALFAEGLQALPDARLVAVGSRSQATADAFARRYGVPRAYASYAALAADAEVEVVYIATPNHLHRDNCCLALDAGKAVLCEKPFTMNAAEAREVIALARQKGLFCMEAMWTRFLPIMARLRDVIDSGVLGDLRLLSADLGFAAPYDPQNRLFNAAMGGGAWLDLGIYPLSLAFLLFGPPESLVSRATIGATGVDEQSAALLHYPQGRLAILAASLRSQLPSEAVLMGTRGRVRIHAPLYRPQRLSVETFEEPQPGASERPRKRRLAALRRNPALRALAKPVRAVLRVLRRQTSVQELRAPMIGNGYNYQATEVMRCLRAGERESPIMPLDETLAIMEVMDAIRQGWTAPGSRTHIEPSQT